MCCLYPGREGVSDNISVISIIGRFLEHSRVFWFANGGEPEVYIGSADWMPRNLDRRVEAVTSIDEPALRQQLERLLQLYLDDNRGSFDMQEDGSFRQRHPEDVVCNSQLHLIEHWKKGLQTHACLLYTSPSPRD